MKDMYEIDQELWGDAQHYADLPEESKKSMSSRFREPGPCPICHGLLYLRVGDTKDVVCRTCRGTGWDRLPSWSEIQAEVYRIAGEYPVVAAALALGARI